MATHRIDHGEFCIWKYNGPGKAKGGFPDQSAAVSAARAVIAARELEWADLRADGGLPEAQRKV